MTDMADLESLRSEIDDINDDIILSVSRRLDLAKKVAAYKRDHSIPILDREREKSVVSVFESRFADRGMRRESGRILARALIDAAVEEERHVVGEARHAAGVSRDGAGGDPTPLPGPV